ncbi:hypothetical protein AB0H28_26920 [Micromonospora sp. NPDC050980]|uniref:hypothetical protein n=1 Tax=Micromonospora sp. NPDC050980 TaxID=3155161 RepID=UPI0033D86302
MHNPTSGEHDLDLAPTDHIRATEAGTGRWRALTDWWRHNRATGFLRDNWLLAVAALTALAVLAVLLWGIWTFVTAIIGAIDAGLGAAGTWVTGGPITHSISDPMRAYLDAHAAGLPATGRDLWVTWLVAAGVLYLAALAGSTYARIGWAAIGALTAAAIYLGAPAGTGPAATGLTAAVWLALSLPAYAATSRVSLGDALDSLTDRRARRATTDTTY